LARAPRVVYVQHQDSLPFRRKTAPRIADSCAFANAPMTACLKTRPKSTSFALSVSPFFNPKRKTPGKSNFPGVLSVFGYKISAWRTGGRGGRP
jgi:hypothetical protein